MEKLKIMRSCCLKRRWWNLKTLILIFSIPFCLLFIFTSFSRPALTIYDTRIAGATQPSSASIYNDNLEIRRCQVDILKKSLLAHYFSQKGQLLSSQYTKFFYFACAHPNLRCGGIGDRLHGIVSAFYIALGSDRVFHIDWRRGSTLSEYFEVNDKFYNVSTELYNERRQMALPVKTPGLKSYNVMMFIDGPNEHRLSNWSSDIDFKFKYRTEKTLAISTNSLAGLEGSLKNPSFYSSLSHVLPGELGNDIDTSTLISAALQIILNSPTKRLADTFYRCVVNQVGEAKWKSAFRIGVQIRQQRDDWNETGSRVVDSQLHCFVEEVQSLVEETSAVRKRSIIIFITADRQQTISYIRNLLLERLGGKFADFSVISTTSENDTCNHDLGLVHTDRLVLSGKENDGWTKLAGPFVDWLALTAMHKLVISRSGFGETASLFSLQHTRRFVHWHEQIGNQPTNYSTACVFHFYNTLGRSLKFETFASDFHATANRFFMQPK